jgi:putative phosphoribosyl transferase
MNRYRDREDAGKVLADHLFTYANQKSLLVLALPRGGVPVAYEVAKKLKVPLDVFVVRKLGVPGHEELAMGAIATGGVEVFNPDIIEHLHINKSQIQEVIENEKRELKRRDLTYRGNKNFPSIKDKTIILVDDGIATGATIRAAISALRKMQPQKLVVGVPVADVDMCRDIAKLVDDFICPLQVVDFYAVGAWYEQFSQTSDEEVHKLLKA